MSDAAMVESSDAEDAISRGGLVYGSPPQDDDYTFEIVFGNKMPSTAAVMDDVIEVKASWLRAFVCGDGSGTQCVIGVDLDNYILHLTSGSSLVRKAADDEWVPLQVQQVFGTREILVPLNILSAPTCGAVEDTSLRHGLEENISLITQAKLTGESVYLKFHYLNSEHTS